MGKYCGLTDVGRMDKRERPEQRGGRGSGIPAPRRIERRRAEDGRAV